MFVVYLIGLTVFTSTRSLERFWSGIFDPVGFILLDDITRYWTVVERNTLLLSWSGVFLYNRLLWLSVGCVSLILLWALFPMSVEALTAVSQGRRAAKAKQQDETELRPVRSLVAATLPKVNREFSPATSWAQFLSLSRLRINTILHEIPFWAIVGLMVALALSNGYFAGRVADTDVWPVTFLMLQAVEGGAVLFFYIIAALYGKAELLWRERDIHFDGIHDSLPMSDSVDWFSKLVAIAFVELALLTVTMLCVACSCRLLQATTISSCCNISRSSTLSPFPQIMTFASCLALFVQTIVSNKFIGATACVIGIFVITPILFNFGWENSLYLFGNTPPYTYSDMNGYGHFVPALFWAITYWLAISAFLGVISIALARRGAEDGWSSRLRLASARLPRLIPAAAICLAVAVGSGVWYYYNAHVLNEYLNAKQRRGIQADYERSFKKFENLAQPKVTAVDTRIDIDPARRSFSGSGHYTLQNKTAEPIAQIHITDQMHSVSNVQFDRPFHLVSSGPRDIYSIYTLEQPLAPGDVLQMTFNVGFQSRGFRDGNEKPELAYNGTFFDASYFPTIGYDRNLELDDPRRRREEHLGQLEEMAPRGDPVQSLYNLLREAVRLDYVPRCGQHVRRSNRHRPRLPSALVGGGWKPLLRVQHGID